MHPCYHRLNISTESALKQTWTFPDHGDKFGIWILNVKDVLNDDWLLQFKENQLELCTVMLFYRGAHYSSETAHIDVTRQLSTWNTALNWCVGGASSEMVWYNTPPGTNIEKDVRWTPAKTAYLSWPIDSLEKIDSCSINSELTAVRTDIPHSIAMGHEPRWCISVRPLQNFTWQELLLHLKNKNL